jgi:hypothetical protein
MSNKLRQLSDASRIFLRAIKFRFTGFKKYSGDSEQICYSIIEDCYDSKNNYFRTSAGHFCQFYSRDFGMCCESLIALGYKKRVVQTLRYALTIFEQEGKITTHITTSGKAVDFPTNSPESASYMLNSVLLTKDKKLLSDYKDFFKKIADDVYSNYLDKNTGLLRFDINFSSMKDHSLRISDCYNNCLLGLFANNLKKASIRSELSKYDYSKIIVNNFWNGSYFIEDLSGKEIISGDANTFPFWTGLVNDKKMFNLCVKAMQKKGLDEPWPLKYTALDDVSKLNFGDFLAPGYERDTLWMHLGLCYLTVVKKYDSKLFKKYLEQYESLIVLHKNFLEVYFPNKKPFNRLFYVCDESMLWCSIFLDLKN